MNRRHFLASLAAASAGAVLDPERLLWVPGRRTHFDIARPDIDAGDFVYFDGIMNQWRRVTWDARGRVGVVESTGPVRVITEGPAVMNCFVRLDGGIVVEQQPVMLDNAWV